VLVPLVAAIEPRDLLKLKAHLDQILAQSQVVVLPTSKLWDGYRAYEKRLTSAKEKGAGGLRGRKALKGGKAAEMVTTDEDEEALNDAPAVPNGVSKRQTRQNRRSATVEYGADAEQENGPTDDEILPSEPEFATPKQKKPRPRPAYKNKSPEKSPDPRPATPNDNSLPATPAPNPSPLSIPRKRARSPEDEEQPDMVDEEEIIAESPQEPVGSQDTYTSELQIRRKRVRH